jgi:hydrogenase-4 component B
VRQALLLVAMALLAGGALVSLVWSTERAWSRWATYGAASVASGLVAATGALCVSGQALTVNLGDLLDFGQTTLRLDQLAGLFLTLTGCLGVVISLLLVNWPAPNEKAGARAIAPGYMLLLASVIATIVAADVFSFLFAWESLTVSFFVLVAATRRRRDQPAAAWVTAAIGKAGGSALLVGFLLLAGASDSFGLASWAEVHPGGLHDVAYALVVFGFGTKVGLTPFQVWMPRGYPAAPGPVRAAMAGLAVNVGFYGLWRCLALLGRPPEWLVAAVLVLGGLTALLGISFAAVQADINAVIAYSSAENGGIIMIGFGVALAGEYVGNSSLVAVGLLAGSLQVLAHAVAKTGLFLGAANFEAAARSSDVGQLSGMVRSHPWSCASFAASALTLAGLPPTIGFVSEWFIFEALMQQFRLHDLTLRLATASAGALVALTAGVAALTFVRLVGFTVLGRPHTAPRQGRAGERAAPSKASLGAIAVSCFGLAAVAPWVVRYIARGLAPDVARSVTLGALKSPWVLQPVFPNFSALSTSWLFVVMPLGFLVVTVATILASKGRFLAVRRVPVWRSATPGVHGEDSYNAFAYANPVRHVLANILGTQKEVAVVEVGPRGPGDGSLVPVAKGDVPSEAEPTEEKAHSHIVFKASVVEPVETYLYRPAIGVYLALARTAKRLQSGRLEAYVGYMLFALIAVLIVAVSVN